MIQAFERSGWPGPLSCAVPVLAATEMPLASAMQQLAVPFWATLSISPWRVLAVCGVIGVFHTLGVVVSSTVPSWATVLSTTYGFIIWPPLATVEATIAMCSGTIW